MKIYMDVGFKETEVLWIFCHMTIVSVTIPD